MADERFVDEPVVGDEIVRAFMYTAGRTRANGTATELPLETLVSLTALGRIRIDTLQFERKVIAQQLEMARSVAEVAASLNLPLRTALILTSEMVADGLLAAEEVVNQVDLPLLKKIREAIAAL